MKRLLLAAFAVFLMLLITAPAYAQDSAIGWNVHCGFTKYDYTDPIVYPNQYPAGHLHMFVGTSPEADSTLYSMRSGGTNCDRKQDTSGYWIPAITKPDGTRIKPNLVDPYYRTQVPYSQVTIPPADLRIIAGNSHATAAQSLYILHWDCKTGGEAGGAVYGFWTEPHNCNGNTDTPRVHIVFPQCWDAVNLDSADHKSHMAYPLWNGSNYYCPATHPRPIPLLNIQYTFPSRSELPFAVNWDAVTFSSGGRYSMHGDWWQTWRDDSTTNGLSELVVKCIRAGVVCGNDPL